jgi:hypothetical protein
MHIRKKAQTRTTNRGMIKWIYLQLPSGWAWIWVQSGVKRRGHSRMQSAARTSVLMYTGSLPDNRLAADRCMFHLNLKPSTFYSFFLCDMRCEFIKKPFFVNPLYKLWSLCITATEHRGQVVNTGVTGFIPARRQVILTEAFCGFSQSLQANARRIPSN